GAVRPHPRRADLAGRAGGPAHPPQRAELRLPALAGRRRHRQRRHRHLGVQTAHRRPHRACLGGGDRPSVARLKHVAAATSNGAVFRVYYPQRGGPDMKIIFYGTRDYDHLYFDLLAADPDYGCTIRFLAANLDADTAPLARGGDAVCAFVNSDCSAPVLEALAAAGIRLLLMRCAGYNNVDLAAAARLGITVLRVPGYSPEAVAEHAMALAQAANRRICKAYIKVRNNNFALDGLLGHNLYGSCAGIVGTGRIGAAMARICHGYGMTVLAFDQYRNPA